MIIFSNCLNALSGLIMPFPNNSESMEGLESVVSIRIRPMFHLLIGTLGLLFFAYETIKAVTPVTNGVE